MLLLLLFGDFFTYPDLDIYERADTKSVAVHTNGTVYLLDLQGKKVVKADSDGKLSSIGRGGEGPGEFNFPFALQILGDDLYVFDMGRPAKCHQFKLDGTFDQVIDVGNHSKVYKTTQGLIYCTTTRLGFKNGDPGALIYLENDQEKKLLNLRFEEPIKSMPNIKQRPIKMPFKPVSTMPDLIRDPVLPRAAVIWGKHRHLISIIDLENNKVLKTIKLSDKPIPFNENWGDERYESVLKTHMVKQGVMTYVKDFPDVFPIIRSLNLIGDGNLYIQRWTATPEKWTPLILDQNGIPAKDPLSKTHTNLIRATIGNQVYVTHFDWEEEVLSLYRAEKSKLPLLFESLNLD